MLSEFHDITSSANLSKTSLRDLVVLFLIFNHTAVPLPFARIGGDSEGEAK